MFKTLEQRQSAEHLNFDEVVAEFASMPEANIQPYEYFKSDPIIGESQKYAFLAEQIDNPLLPLTSVEDSDLVDSSRRLEKLIDVVGTDTEGRPDMVHALFEVVAERLASVYFIRQARRVADMSMQQSEYLSQVAHLQALNNDLYGVPDKHVFDVLMTQEREQARRALETTTIERDREIVNQYLDMTSQVTEVNDSVYIPSESTVEYYHGVVKAVFADMLTRIDIDPKKSYTPNEIAAVFRSALSLPGISEDWLVEIEEGATNINVDQVNQKINVGADRVSAMGTRLAGLVLHEVGVHVLRRENGEKTDNPLLWNLGLAGYYTSEEGLGKFVEQSLKNKASISGVPLYVNCGLSLGLDGVPRDFRQIFEIEWRRIVVDKINQGRSVTDEVVNKAKKSAYNIALRVRRGMPSDVEGVAFTKDLAYFCGSTNIWRFMEENRDDPTIMQKVLIGKHDPLRADHVRLVSEAVKNYE